MVDSNSSWLKPALDLQKSIVEQTGRTYRTALTVTRDLQSRVTDLARDQLNAQLQIPRVELKLFKNTARRFLSPDPSKPTSADSNSRSERPETIRELEDINGIGPSYAEKLRAAGIQDSSDLAACSPSEVADLIDTGLVNEQKASEWIEGAAGQ